MILTEERQYKLWESVGRQLVEYKLSPEQIQQIFQSVENDLTAKGGNRTLLGKGKDAASAVNKAWEDLKTKMQDSGPVKGFDQKVNDALNKIGLGSADPAFENQVSSWVQKYRNFAKEHPVAQGAIYAVLIALTGLSGAGIAGAAALGLLKLADRVLQGDRFTSALYKGAKTGATAYAASKVGDMIKGQQQANAVSGEKVLPVQGQQTPMPGQPISGTSTVDATLSGVQGTDIINHPVYQQVYAQEIAKWGGNPGAMAIQNAQRIATMKAKVAMAGGMQESKQSYINKEETARAWMLRESLGRPRGGVVLTEAGINVVFEGVMDWLKTKGRNLTTKVTADKLMQAWKKAGSPDDSGALMKVLADAGVPQDVTDGVFTSLGISAGPEMSTEPEGGADTTVSTTPADDASDTAPTPAPEPAPTPAPTNPAADKFVQQLIAGFNALTAEEKAEIQKELEIALDASENQNIVKGVNEALRKQFDKLTLEDIECWVNSKAGRASNKRIYEAALLEISYRKAKLKKRYK